MFSDSYYVSIFFHILMQLEHYFKELQSLPTIILLFKEKKH
jgi:hypothetical protein